MRILLWSGLACWVALGLLWICALCAAARRPVNRRRHNLGRLLVVNVRLF
jgi:hypothetical protein